MSLGYKSLGTLVIAGSLAASLPAWANDKPGPTNPSKEQAMQATYAGDESTMQAPVQDQTMTPSEITPNPSMRRQQDNHY